MRASAPALQLALAYARGLINLIYVNDAHGSWDGDAPGHVARAIAGKGGELVTTLAPAPKDAFLFKPRYSGFDGTALEHLLEDLEVTRIVLAGAATEMCVAQTAIDARERGFQVTVLHDACATVDPANERVSLEYLEHVTGSVLLSAADWTRSSG
jgi:nicotinamidase-related amidase